MSNFVGVQEVARACGANRSFHSGNSSRSHSEGAPATEESVFPYSRSQILQSLGLHQNDDSLFKSTHLETLTLPCHGMAASGEAAANLPQCATSFRIEWNWPTLSCAYTNGFEPFSCRLPAPPFAPPREGLHE
jgi:hypothetical protein